MEDLNKKHQEKLSEFQKKIRGKTGERILFVEEAQPTHGRGPDRGFNLGVLSGDSYYIEQENNFPKVCVPTNKHVNFNYHMFHGEWRYDLRQGPIKIESYSLCFLGKKLSPDILPPMITLNCYEIPQRGLLVFLGEEIDSYFFNKEKRLALHPDEILPIIDYVNILRLAEADIPQNVDNEYSEAYFRQQVNVVSEIEKLERIVLGLEAKIGIVRRKVGQEKQETISRKPIFEKERIDKMDALFLTWGEREKLAETEGKLHRTLRNAVKLGMNQGERRTLELGHGISIELPRYILAKLQYHEVTV